MTHETPAQQAMMPTRRTIAKGAAWSLPVVAIGSAAPALAASGDPSCQNCLFPVLSVGGSGAFLGPDTVGVFPPVTDGKADLTVAGAFTFNATGCQGIISAQGLTVNSATVTMTLRNGSTETYTENIGLSLGLGVGGQSVFADGVIFSGVNAPAGVYAGLANVGLLPTRPTRICFNVSYFIQIGGKINACSNTVCYGATIANAVVGAEPVPGVTYGTVWSGLA